VAKQQPERRFALLYDKVCRQDILLEAWQRVKSNKGAAGVDEVDIDEVREYGEARFLGEIEQELRDGSYRAWLVRRVHLAKSGQPGKTRPLGIPTVSANCTRAQFAFGMGGDPPSVPPASRPAFPGFEGTPNRGY